MNKAVRRSIVLLVIGILLGSIIGSLAATKVIGQNHRRVQSALQSKIDLLTENLNTQVAELTKLSEQQKNASFEVVYLICDFWTGELQKTVTLGNGDLKDGRIELYHIDDSSIQAVIADKEYADRELCSSLASKDMLYEEGNTPH